MTFAYRFTPTAMDAAGYDQVIARLEQAGEGHPSGRRYHVCYAGDGGAVQVFDVWDDTSDFDRFGHTLHPILQELGMDTGLPEVRAVHHIAAGRSAHDNVATHKAAHDAFNRRDFEAMSRPMRNDALFTDHARNLTVKGPAEFQDWAKEWATAFSDARISEAQYIDGGDYTVALFQGRGTNDGPMGSLPATGHRMDLAFCDVNHYDPAGNVVRGDTYYDTMSIMVQLGHMQAPPAG